jgi:hypothetical protein
MPTLPQATSLVVHPANDGASVGSGRPLKLSRKTLLKACIRSLPRPLCRKLSMAMPTRRQCCSKPIHAMFRPLIAGCTVLPSVQSHVLNRPAWTKGDWRLHYLFHRLATYLRRRAPLNVSAHSPMTLATRFLLCILLGLDRLTSLVVPQSGGTRLCLSLKTALMLNSDERWRKSYQLSLSRAHTLITYFDASTTRGHDYTQPQPLLLLVFNTVHFS